MKQVKISKDIISEPLKSDTKTFLNKYKKEKNVTVTEDDKNYVFLFNDEETYSTFIKKMSYFIVTEVVDCELLKKCLRSQFNKTRTINMLKGFHFLYKNFIQYGLTVEMVSLRLYLKENNEISLDSYMLFNMAAYRSDLLKILNDKKQLEALKDFSVTNFANINSIAYAVQKFKPFLIKNKISRSKDLKVYMDKRTLKVAIDSNIIIDKTFIEKHLPKKISLNNSDVVCCLILCLTPKRVIFFSSIKENFIKTVDFTMRSFSAVYNDYKIFTADELSPIQN